MAKKPTVPKTLGGCADRLYDLRQKRQTLTKQIEEIKAEESVVKEKLINNLKADDAQGVLGRKARAAITSKVVASVRDWDKFYKHILKTKDFSLMQRRPADAAVRERWEDNKKVPGVEPFTVFSVSLTKI